MMPWRALTPGVALLIVCLAALGCRSQPVRSASSTTARAMEQTGQAYIRANTKLGRAADSLDRPHAAAAGGAKCARDGQPAALQEQPQADGAGVPQPSRHVRRVPLRGAGLVVEPGHAVRYHTRELHEPDLGLGLPDPALRRTEQPVV